MIHSGLHLFLIISIISFNSFTQTCGDFVATRM
jgi:hypothetical protein